MKNSIVVILIFSLIVIFGCKDKTETEKVRDTTKDEAVVQKQEAVEKPEIQDLKEEEPTQEVSITIKEGQFEPKAFELVKNKKVRFRVKSLDVEHTFVIPSLKINETINPGEEITFEVVPDSGEPFIHFHCDIHGMFLENGTITMK